MAVIYYNSWNTLFFNDSIVIFRREKKGNGETHLSLLEVTVMPITFSENRQLHGKNNHLHFRRNYTSFPVEEGKVVSTEEHQLINVKYQLIYINFQSK